MSREFNFPKFTAGEPLLQQLTAARLNAILDAIDRNRVEFGDNITGQRTPGGTIVRTKLGTGGGAAGTFPFELIEGTDEADPPLPTVSFTVGKIGNSIPTLYGTTLTDTPKHSVSSANDFKAWLQVNITAEFDNYHPKIDDAEIIVETAAANPTREDFKIEWENPDDKVSGAFFILIADFTVAAVPGSDPEVLTITSVDQWLNVSYRAIVMLGLVDDDWIIPVG